MRCWSLLEPELRPLCIRLPLALALTSSNAQAEGSRRQGQGLQDAPGVLFEAFFETSPKASVKRFRLLAAAMMSVQLDTTHMAPSQWLADSISSVDNFCWQQKLLATPTQYSIPTSIWEQINLPSRAICRDSKPNVLG